MSTNTSINNPVASNNNVIVHVACRMCYTLFPITVPVEGYNLWRNGTVIQKAMPELSVSDRELLISQTCDACWSNMFADEEEEEDFI